MGLDSVELVMEVEDEFGMKLSDQEAESVHTVADLVELVMSRRPDADRQEVIETVCKLTAEIVGLKADQVHLHSDLVKDLEYD